MKIRLNLPALKNSYYYNDDGDDKQSMNDISGMKCKESKKPSNNKNDGKYVK
jgi:hypothetical protein